jgi:hypothetical protein
VAESCFTPQLTVVISRILVLAILVSVASAAAITPSDESASEKGHTYDSQTAAGDLVCRPFGECEPCPADEVRSAIQYSS